MGKMIVAAGHICLDITPAFPDKAVNRVEEILVPGRLLQMGTADVHVGGAVANTGLGLKVLGADVKLMGKIGTDAFGEMVLSQLEHYQAQEGMILSQNENTAYSVVVAPQGIDRIFLHHSGANDTFQCSDLDFGIIKKAALFHFGYPPLMKSMYENQGEELIRIFKTVKAMGVATSLDMAAIDESSPAGAAEWDGILEQLLPYVDFFVPSIEELVYMLDRQKYNAWVARADGGDFTLKLSPEQDIKPMAEKLLNMGAKVVLIKCGAPGMYFATGNREDLETVGGGIGSTLTEWDNQSHFEPSYKPERIKSGTGAGDTSIAAFLYAVTLGMSWEKCLQMATATGASCVEHYDALSGLKSFAELEKKIRAGWEKQ